MQINKKNYFVHRLVAERYIPNPCNLPQVNHINGNKTDNSVKNLEWVDNQTNRTHAVKKGLHLQGEDCPYSKLNWDKVEYIRKHNEISNKEFSEMYGVSASTISDVKNFRTWKNKIEKIC